MRVDKKILFFIFLSLGLSCQLWFLSSDCKEMATHFRGYLLDKQCSESVRDDALAEEFIKNHTKDCCLMENCRRNGYGLYVKPNWYNLDAQGNKIAVRLLRQSKREHSFLVQVEGSLKGGVLKVESIKEVDSQTNPGGVEAK